MTNFEKYREEIEKLESKHKLAIDLDNNVTECCNLDCSDCKFNQLTQPCTKSRFDWLFDEYKKNLKASAKEKALIENVGIVKNVKFRYIARDKNGFLYLYEEMPSKDGDIDIYTLEEGYCLEIHESLFPWIRYEDGVYDIETSQFIKVE